MDCKKELARIKNKEKLTMVEFDELVEFAEVELSFFDRLGSKGKLQRIIKEEFDSIIHLLNEEAIPNVLYTKTNDDTIKEGIMKYAIEYLNTCFDPKGILQLNSEFLSIVYDMAYSKENELSQSKKELRDFLENDDTFKKILKNLYIGDFPRLIDEFDTEEARNSFLKSLNSNFDEYINIAMIYSDLDSKLLFNNKPKSAYYLLAGNFERFYNKIKEDRNIINLLGNIDLKDELDSHEEFKKEIYSVIEKNLQTDDFKNEQFFTFVCSFCSQTDSFDILAPELESLFDSRKEDLRFDILSSYIAEYYQDHPDKEDDFKRDYLSLIKDRFNRDKLESDIDYVWFIDVLAKIDRPFLFANLEKISDLVTPEGINDFIYYIKTTPDAEYALNVLTKKSRMFLEKTDIPLSTFKYISLTESSLKERLGDKSEECAQLDYDELKELMSNRVNDIAYEIGDKFKNDPIKIQLLEALLKELLENEQVAPCDIQYLSKGSYSSVYQIGEKVLKIGKEPEHFIIPKNHKRLIQPFLRRRDVFTDGERKKYYIEISELCDMSEKPSLEELYEIYKELRDEGLVWTDAFEGNVGRLKKPNSRYFKKIGEVDNEGKVEWGSISHADHSAGLGKEGDNVENQAILDKGEYVVIDLDYIFDENDPHIIWPKGRYSRDFEIKYQNENKKKNKKSKKENLEKE